MLWWLTRSMAGRNSYERVSSSRIHRETGVLLPLSHFFAQPTILQLAQFLDHDSHEHAVARQASAAETRTEPPLFLLGWYLDLESLDLVGGRYYVLPFPDFALSSAECRVEHLAEVCLPTLRGIQPHGPYRIAGYSLAGLVAYEMACRLIADGEVVQVAGIVDTVPAPRMRRAGPQAISALARLLRLSFRSQLLLARGWFYVLDLAHKGRHEGLWQLAHGMASDMQRAAMRGYLRLARLIRPSAATDVVRQGTPSAPAWPHVPFGRFWAHRWAHSLYRPPKYAGIVTLFASEELAAQYPAPGRGWKKWARGVREYAIPGSHGSCVTSHKAELADQFKACLAELNRESSLDSRRAVLD